MTQPSQPDGASVSQADRDWPEGRDYTGVCHTCNGRFYGPKFRIMARKCYACFGTEAFADMRRPARELVIHELKTWPVYFAEVKANRKGFELRKDDRDFQAGDTLRLLEWDHETLKFTGRIVDRLVTYVLRGTPHLAEGYCAMSIQDSETSSLRAQLAKSEARADSKHRSWMDELKRLAEVEKQFSEAIRERDEAREFIAKLEWSGVVEDQEGASYNHCPICEAHKGQGHREGCELDAMLTSDALRSQVSMLAPAAPQPASDSDPNPA